MSKYVEKCECKNCGNEASIDYIDRTSDSILICPICGYEEVNNSMGLQETEDRGFGTLNIEYPDKNIRIFFNKIPDIANEIKKLSSQKSQIKNAFICFEDKEDIYHDSTYDFEVLKNNWKKLYVFKNSKYLLKSCWISGETIVLKKIGDKLKEVKYSEIKEGETFVLKEYKNISITKAKTEEDCDFASCIISK